MNDRKKVLIIDDEENFAYIVKLNLEETGSYEVAVEPDPTRALSAARAVNPDVILLDVIMPVRDGFEVLEALKKDKRTMSIPVIMLTAVGTDQAKIKASEKYSEDYITKPVTTEALREKIENVLKRRR